MTSKRSFPLISIILPLSLLAFIAGLGTSAKRANTPPVNQFKQPPTASYIKLPLSFEVNEGQSDPGVKFLSRGSGYTLFLTGSEAVLALQKLSAVSSQRSAFRNSKFESRNWAAFNPQIPFLKRQWLVPWATDGLRGVSLGDHQSSIDNSSGPRSEPPAPAVLRMKLVGADAAARVTGLEELPGKSNYFIGKDPKKWRTNVPNYARVQYKGVYPGVDLVYYGNQRQLEYDFVVAPGGDPEAIKLAVAAMSPSPTGGPRQRRGELRPPLQIDANGDLVIGTGDGEVRFHKPTVYQARASGRGPRNSEFRIQNSELLDGRYVFLANNQIGFEVGAYDRTKPLIIDPVLSYSSFLGGSDQDGGSSSVSIAVDSFGNAYVAAGTASLNFPTTPGAVQRTFGGAPSVCNTGYRCGDALVSKINSTGSALVYSTYLGGSGNDYAYGLAVDSSGNAYVTGDTTSTNFPTTNGAFQAANAGNGDVFVAKLNATGSNLIYSTYLGGSNYDNPQGLVVDASGNAYVAGRSVSPDFPTTPGAFQTALADGSNCTGCGDAFVTKVNATGTALAYSTYLGGSSYDGAVGVAVNSNREAYVTGNTYSADFPTTVGAFERNFHPGGCGQSPYTYDCDDVFVTKLNAAGNALLYSTYLGGTGGECPPSMAVDSAGNAYVVGLTSSRDFPTTLGAYQVTSAKSPCRDSEWGCKDDAFVSKIDPTKAGPDSLVYSTYLGGSRNNWGTGIAVDSFGYAYVTGITSSTDFPYVNGVQIANAGGNDVFVAKLNPAGSRLIYSTYLGGSHDELADFIAVDTLGYAYVAGWTESPDLPTTPRVFQPGFGGGTRDLFVAKIAPFNAPGVSLSTGTLVFGPQPFRTTSAPKTFILRNVGSAPMAITAITTSASFAQTNSCGPSVPGGTNCTIRVTFNPGAIGLINGTLTIEDNAVNAPKPQTVHLFGFGTGRRAP
jgi:hypothetical protein